MTYAIYFHHPQDETYEPYAEGIDLKDGECSLSELADDSPDDDDLAWDESVHGERLIYDSTYESNDDLTPWNFHRKTKLILVVFHLVQI